MNVSFFWAGRFWIAMLIALLTTGLLFAWELNILTPLGLLGPPRMPATQWEVIMTIIITLLFSVNIGLIAWRMQCGTCPIGTKRVSGVAAGLGALALLCPACLLVPLGIAGLSFGLAFLVPFIPLMHIIAIILLLVNLFILIPRRTT
jgi:hypothetical protein